MSTATVRQLRTDYAKLLSRVELGEEVTITRRGKAVARLSPVQARASGRVDWTQSAAFAKRPIRRSLTTKQTSALWEELRGD
jgi:prevent-host-death family protein